MIEEVQEKEGTEGALSEDALVIINRDLVPFLETVRDMVKELEPNIKKLSHEMSPVVNQIKANLDRDETIVLIEKLTANTGTLIELVSFMEALNDLRRELEPNIKKLSSEASPVVGRIKANIDRDETLLLIEKLTANTGTLIELVSFMEALNDLRKELEPNVKKLTAEASPVVSRIKANIDRDETLLLVEKLTANTGTLIELISFTEALNDLRKEIEPNLKKLTGEAGPVLSSIKANIDRDETLVLIEKLTSNTGTLIEMLSFMEALNDLRKELEPNIKKLSSEVSPVVTSLRSFAENENTWDLADRTFKTLQAFADDEEVRNLVERAPSLKEPLVKFMGCMCARNGDGEEGAPLVETSLDSLLKLTEIASAPVIQQLVASAATAIKEVNTAEIKAVSPLGMFAALRDDDVQRAIGFLFYFLKQLGQGLKTTP